MHIEGYAALFGVADLEGDVIAAGAFWKTLRARGSVPMLLRHDARHVCGVWRRFAEDARGLYVHGEIEARAPAGLLAQRLVCGGMDGLSIGFVTRASTARPGGRVLHAVDLIEISIVPEPMAPRARLTRSKLVPRKELTA